MNSPRSVAAWLICFSLGGLAAPAQTPPANVQGPSEQPTAVPDIEPMYDARRLRGDIATGIVAGTETAEAAIDRLRVQASPSGLQIEPDADFAFAANDIGRRLIVAGKPGDAERFFQESEKSLTLMILKTPDKSAAEKSQYLTARANIRAKYLNKPAEAKTDIDEAIRLQPDNTYLKHVRANLGSERGEFFKEAPKS